MLSLSDRNGNGLTVDGNGVIHSSGKSVVFTRDGQNRITHVTDPNGEQLVYETLYTYDFNDNELTMTDALGNVTSKTYDASDNMLTETQWVTAPDGMVVQAVTSYTYDEFNNPLSITDANGNVTFFEYDGAGNLGRTTYPDLTTMEMAYDLENRQISTTDQLARTTYMVYDELGRQTQTILPDQTPGDLNDNPRTITDRQRAERDDL